MWLYQFMQLFFIHTLAEFGPLKKVKLDIDVKDS